MATATANGIELSYEVFGQAQRPALLLIAGNGAQRHFWDAEFCELLVRAGFRVIRFDNRDAGQSTRFDQAGVPDIMAMLQAAMAGKAVEAPYRLEDMADDAVGLLDALGVDKAHICGASMGGMIAQVLACRHPGRALSLTSIMSCTGNPAVPMGDPEAIAAVVAPAPEGREAYVEHTLGVWRKIWSPGYPFEEARARRFLVESYDRGNSPAGMARQNAAVMANGDRRAALGGLRLPALVIHGESDPLIPVDAGKDTARAIPGARLLLLPGMGHDMPREVWPKIVAAMAEHLSLRDD